MPVLVEPAPKLLRMSADISRRHDSDPHQLPFASRCELVASAAFMAFSTKSIFLRGLRSFLRKSLILGICDREGWLSCQLGARGSQIVDLKERGGGSFHSAKSHIPRCSPDDKAKALDPGRRRPWRGRYRRNQVDALQSRYNRATWNSSG